MIFDVATQCKAPALINGSIIITPVKSSYDVGYKVTYKCKTGDEVVDSYCLSDGTWSPVGYVCGGKQYEKKSYV